MGAKESALYEALRCALNQYENYFYRDYSLRNVSVRELNFENARFYSDQSNDTQLSSDRLENAKYAMVTEIIGMVDYVCDSSDIPSGSRPFMVNSISFDITYEYRDNQDFFTASIINDKIEIQFV